MPLPLVQDAVSITCLCLLVATISAGWLLFKIIFLGHHLLTGNVCLMLLLLFQLCSYHCHLFSGNSCSHCHCHHNAISFNAVTRQMLSTWHAVVVGAITWCCCHQWHCCLVLLFMMPFTAPVTFPLPSAFWCWLSLLTVCHQQLLLSTITINHCCWPLPLIIAVDHCCWPLLSPTPLPFIVAWLLLSLLSISVIVNRYLHHCHHCCCYCSCYCHHCHHHCGASAVLHRPQQFPNLCFLLLLHVYQGTKCCSVTNRIPFLFYLHLYHNCTSRILYPTKVHMISISTFLILMGMPRYIKMICVISTL